MVYVFYDDRCGLCAKEIAYYKKKTIPGTISWLAISENEAELRQRGISLYDALKHLHAINEEGMCVKGVDTFILIWQHLPRMDWLAKLVKLSLIYKVTSWGYQHFANWRFNRLEHCQISQDSNDAKHEINNKTKP